MADSVKKIIEIVFAGDDKLSGTIGDIGSAFSSLEGKLQDVLSPLAAVADGVLKADAALAALVAGGLALSIKASGDFGDAFQEITTLIGASGEEVNQFRSDILDYAKDSGKSLADITQSTYAAVSAGIAYKDAINSLSQAEKLSIAGKAELSSTTVLLAGTLNAYGESIDSAEKFSDIFFTTVKLGQTTIPELAQSLSNVTGIAAGAGIPIETLTAAVAALTASGLPTAQAITGIKAAIANIIKPTGNAEKAAAALGIQFDSAALQSKGFEGVLKDVFIATDGNIGKMTGFFESVEGLNAALILAGDTSGKFANALEEMRNAAGATEKAYAKMADNFSIINQKIANNVRLNLIGIGDKIIDTYKDVAEGVVSILQSIGGEVGDETFDPFFKLINDFGEKAIKLFEAIAKVLPEAFKLVDLSPLLDAIKDLSGEFGEFFDDIDLATPEGLAEAIQFVVESIASLIKVTAGMVEAFKPMLDSILSTIKGFNMLDETDKKLAGNVLLAAKAIVSAGLLISGALILIGKNAELVKDIFDVVFGSIKIGVNVLQTAFDTVAIFIVKTITVINEAMGQIVGVFSKDLGEEFSKTSAKLVSLVDNIKQAQADNFQELVDGETQVLKALGLVTDETANIKEGIEAIPSKKDVVVVLTAAETAEFERQFDEIFGPNNVITVEAQIVPSPENQNFFADFNEQMEKARAGATVDVELEVDLSESELTKIKTQADIVQTAMEFAAKLDIAEIEAGARVMEAAFDSVSESFDAAADATSTMFTAFANFEGTNFEKLFLQDILLDQVDIQTDLAASQVNLNSAQADFLRARAVALQEGGSLISISADGLEPEIEAFMWKILGKVQIRATESGSEFLLGFQP